VAGDHSQVGVVDIVEQHSVHHVALSQRFAPESYAASKEERAAANSGPPPTSPEETFV
jgi:hypothetical protein